MPYLAYDESLPVISTGAVKAALERMVFAYRPHRPSPLCELYLVDQVMKAPTFPSALHLRQYALHIVLTDLIRTRFEHMLAVFRLPPPQEHQPYDDALEHLRACSQVRKPELMG